MWCFFNCSKEQVFLVECKYKRKKFHTIKVMASIGFHRISEMALNRLKLVLIQNQNHRI